MAEFASAHGKDPGGFISSNTLTAGQTAQLREYAYLASAIKVLDGFREDILKRLKANEEPFPLADRLTIEWVPEEIPTPEHAANTKPTANPS